MADQNQQLDSFKQKYASALELMPRLGISLSHVHIANGKLFVQGEAPSDTAKNKAWDEVKRIDPTYSDLTLDLTINNALPDPATAQGMAAAGGMASPGGNLQTYTVQPGDTLSLIAKQVYGNANDYQKIFEANRDQLKDPDHIKAGQTLKIPAK